MKPRFVGREKERIDSMKPVSCVVEKGVNFAFHPFAVAGVCFGGFERKVWPFERTLLEKKADQVNESLRRMRLIEQWEDITGSEYNDDRFSVSLCSSVEAGPDANDLEYCRNVHYYDRETPEILSFISHEVGIRILRSIPLISRTSDLFPDPGERYVAVESLAEYYNGRIIGRRLEFGFGNDWISRFELIHSQDPAINPEHLLLRAYRDRCNEGY